MAAEPRATPGGERLQAVLISCLTEKLEACLQEPYLQDVVQQRDPGLIGFGLGQFEQSAHLEAFGVPRVTPLQR